MSTLILCFCLAVQEEKNTNLDDLVMRNQAHFALIKSISLEIDATISLDGGKNFEKMEKVSWQKTTTAERYKSTVFGAFSDGKWETMTTFSDAYHGRESRVLRNFDPDSPPKLPIRPGTLEFSKIKGFIQRAPGEETIRKYAVYLWLMFNADFSHSLLAVRNLNPDMQLAGLVDVGGKKLWEVRFQEDGNHTTVYLDPKANYAISKTLYVPKGALTKTECSVLEFREFPGGVFIPIHVRNVSSGDFDDVVDIKVTRVNVNEELSEDALKMNFPEGIFVSDFIRDKIVIWSEKEPKLEFSSKNDDFKNWYAAQAGPVDLTTAFILINITIVSVLILVVYIRRRSKRLPKGDGDAG
jgi:hypothetical protein